MKTIVRLAVLGLLGAVALLCVGVVALAPKSGTPVPPPAPVAAPAEAAPAAPAPVAPAPPPPPPPAPKADLALTLDSCQATSIGQSKVSGRVTNNGTKAATFVRIKATVSAGGITNDGATYADAQTLAPGQTATWTAYVTTPGAGGTCSAQIESYR